MNNVYWGIAVVVLCVAGYYAAYQKQRQGQYAVAVMLLVACGLIVRMYTAADLFLHFWDERYHALVAKNLSRHLLVPTLYDNPVLPYSYKSWEYNHIWVHKQPVTLWLMALSFKLFGVHAWVARMPSVLLSTIGIKMVYDIGARLYSRQVGFVAAFLFSINGLVIELAAGRVATDHVDVAFMFFVLMAVWSFVKSIDNKLLLWSVIAGLGMGAAVLCKWLPAFIALPVGVLILMEHATKKQVIVRSLIAMAAAAIVFLPWQWYILTVYNKEATWEYAFNIMHFKEVLADQGGGFFYHFDMLRMNYGELVYLPVLWFTYIAITKRRLSDLAILTWFWVPYIFFSFSATKMQAYTLFAAPAVFFIISKAFYAFKDRYQEAGKLKWLAAAVVYGLVLLPIRYSIERVKPFTAMDRNPAWLQAIAQFKKTSNNTPRTVVLNCSHPLEMMFETDCVCYPGYDAIPKPPAEMGLIEDAANKQLMPDAAVIARLKSSGYTVLKETNNIFVEL